jgi:hypothetical protein
VHAGGPSGDRTDGGRAVRRSRLLCWSLLANATRHDRGSRACTRLRIVDLTAESCGFRLSLPPETLARQPRILAVDPAKPMRSSRKG